MKLFVLILFCLPKLLFANECFSALQNILVMGSIDSSRTQIRMGIHPYPATVAMGNSIIRYGEYKIKDVPERLSGVFEIEINKLQPLHPIPNPIREGSRQRLDELLRTFKLRGYDLLHPVSIAIMPNLSMKIISGHHRVEAMKSLGERTIPATIYLWHRVDVEDRLTFRELFVDKLKRFFPQYHQDLITNPKLWDGSL